MSADEFTAAQQVLNVPEGRIVTAAEARDLAKPVVQALLVTLNRALVSGRRLLVVETALAPDVRAELLDAGWTIVSEESSNGVSLILVTS